MKHILFLTCLLLAVTNLIAQREAPSTNDYLASTGGIGPIKTGMNKNDVEKLLNTTLKLPHTSQPSNWDYDTVKATYKDMPLQLVFSREYVGTGNNTRITLYSVQSSHPMVKTKSGVGIGDDKLKIVKTYEQFHLSIEPEWVDSKPNTSRSIVRLYDNDNPKTLIFYLDNNIITRIEVTAWQGE